MHLRSAIGRALVCAALATASSFGCLAGTSVPVQEVDPTAAAEQSSGDAGSGELQIPPSQIHYSIEVHLDPQTRKLSGKETVTWTNTLDTTVPSLPMHLYLNGFSHDASTWFRSTLDTRFLLSSILDRFPDPWGWTEPKVIRQNGFELEWFPVAPDDGNILDRSLIEVRLAEPVEPGAQTTLEIEWDGRLPAAAARTGGYDRFFFSAQWFPKIAGVRPDGTFNRHQFHGPTEFFADFADFDVLIGVPEGWGIASTGKGARESTADGTDWHRYRQQAVHDFAFTTGADMQDSMHRHTLPNGREVEIHIFQPSGLEHQVDRWRKITAACLDTMSTRIAPYPYDTVTVVLPPRAGLRAVGMEYPTLFTGLPGGELLSGALLGSTRFNELVIAHEFAHQYFYGIVATNEFEDAFMDEGMTEYWGSEIMLDSYGDAGGAGSLFGRPIGVSDSNISAQSPRIHRPAIWSGPSYLSRGSGVGQDFYNRPAVTYRTAAGLFGQEKLDAVFSEYARRWAFKHPRLEDFLAVSREVGGDAMADMLWEAFRKPGLPDYKVLDLESKVYYPPYGRLFTEDGPVDIDEDWDGDSLVGLDPAAWEEDGTVTVEILDPGYTRESRVMGRIERRKLVPQSGKIDKGYEEDEETFYESTARIEGPGWDHLPVQVLLRFADGAVVVDDWDGKSISREYRVLRSAPLSEIVIDPDRVVALDLAPVNNGLSRRAEGPLSNDWSWWMGGLFQWLAEGAGAWL